MYILTTDLLLQNERPVLSSEREPHMDRTVTIKQERHQDRWTDRQSQSDVDTDFVAARRRYELSERLQDLYIDVALLSETHLKPH
jgi:hypothetical protein